jgi:hypothetical protein
VIASERESRVEEPLLAQWQADGPGHYRSALESAFYLVYGLLLHNREDMPSGSDSEHPS